MTTLLTNIREQQPLVLNVANLVTMQRVADAINVLGASPLMTDEVTGSRRTGGHRRCCRVEYRYLIGSPLATICCGWASG